MSYLAYWSVNNIDRGIHKGRAHTEFSPLSRPPAMFHLEEWLPGSEVDKYSDPMAIP